jgi:hypothetical protein
MREPQVWVLYGRPDRMMIMQVLYGFTIRVIQRDGSWRLTVEGDAILPEDCLELLPA